VKKQLILAFGGLLLLLSLFFFGQTVEKKPAPPKQQGEPAFDITAYKQAAIQKLSPSRQLYVSALENRISRGDVKDQQIESYNVLASFWKDSIKEKTLYEFYLAESSKLVKSPKTLNFAAQLILDDLRSEPDMSIRNWKADEAIELFDQAIALEPTNDSLKVGLGASYIFGKGIAGDAGGAMTGVLKLKEIVSRDSTNMQAQFVLGAGDVISEQYDKAIERLLMVVRKAPDNIEAVSWLADAYNGKGDKVNAIKWYEMSKRMVNDPQYSKEVDDRIKLLR